MWIDWKKPHFSYVTITGNLLEVMKAVDHFQDMCPGENFDARNSETLRSLDEKIREKYEKITLDFWKCDVPYGSTADIQKTLQDQFKVYVRFSSKWHPERGCFI